MLKLVEAYPNLSRLFFFQVSIGHIILSTGWSNWGSCTARASWRIFLFYRCGCTRTGRFRLVKSWQQKIMEKIPICLAYFWSLLCAQGKEIIKRLGNEFFQTLLRRFKSFNKKITKYKKQGVFCLCGLLRLRKNNHVSRKPCKKQRSDLVLNGQMRVPK